MALLWPVSVVQKNKSSTMLSSNVKSIDLLMDSGVIDGGGARGRAAPPGKLNLKTGPPFADILIFIILVFFRWLLFFLRFSGYFSFFTQFRYPRHPSSLSFLNFFLSVG